MSNAAMASCRVCEAPLALVLDAGALPLSSAYLAAADAPEARRPLQLGQCERCGLIQLFEAWPAEALRCPYDWLVYREAEDHLDRLVDQVCALPGITTASTVCGVSYKDASTLERLRHRGYSPAQLDLAPSPQSVEAVAGAAGAFDLVVVRHTLEHADDPRGFIRALTGLLHPGGYLLLEAPDSTGKLSRLDYTLPWEEHVLYFTPETFGRTLRRSGMAFREVEVHPGPIQNSMVAICRPGASTAAGPAPGQEFELARSYGRQFADRRDQVRARLAGYRQQGGRVALFGAGHDACMFLNLLDLRDRVDLIVDDDPHKRGLHMPGSRLPIVGSAALDDPAVGLCLMCLSLDAERKVLRKLEPFQRRGGVVGSIYPGSEHAFFPTAGLAGVA